MRQVNMLAISIIVLMFLVSFYFLPLMPQQVVTHWNEQGIPDGFMPKFWGMMFVPLFTLAIWLILTGIVRIDPLKKNIEEFRKYYDNFMILILVFFFYIHSITILWNVGVMFSVIHMIMPAIGAILFYAGILMENSKRNWFIGVRTPWTMGSDEVWARTNKLGGLVFKILGVIDIIGSFFPEYFLYIIIIPLISAVVLVVVYSYISYKNNDLKKKKT